MFYLNPGHLNDIHVMIKLEMGKFCSIKQNGRLGGKGQQYRSLALRVGPATFLCCKTYLAVQLTSELELQQTRYKNEKNVTIIAISVV